MVVSSRTPEGSPIRCPLCGNALRIEPSVPFLDASCPACGQLLWFANLPTESRVFDQPGKARILRALAEQLGVPEDEVLEGFALGTDSLDLAELELELSDLDP